MIAMLFNLSSIPADELLQLLLSESKKFTTPLDRLPYNDVQGIRQNLKAIVNELEKRNNKGKP